MYQTMQTEAVQRKNVKARKEAENNPKTEREESVRDTNENPRLNDNDNTSSIRIDFKRIFIRCAVILIIIFIMNYYSQTEKTESFASLEIVERKFVEIPCSEDYIAKHKKFKGSSSLKCGRAVSDRILSNSEVKVLLDFVGGTLYMASMPGEVQLDIQHLAKSSKQFFNQAELETMISVIGKLKKFVSKEFGVPINRLHVSEKHILLSHVSAAQGLMAQPYSHLRNDQISRPWLSFSTRIFLSQIGRDFSGGKEIFVDTHSNKTVHPIIGRTLVYSSGSENVHAIEVIFGGVRLALDIAFTMDTTHAAPTPLFGGFNKKL